MNEIVQVFLWPLSAYVFTITVVQIFISVLTYTVIRRNMEFRRTEVAEFMFTGLEPPISIVVPAYNEEQTIVTSVRSLLQLRYGEFEVIVVNDGSTDRTLRVLTEAFDLKPFPQVFVPQLLTKPVRGAYYSLTHPALQVIDKENGGGKADANNCGVNAARYPLFCCTDADSILDRDALLRVVQPFIEDPRTVACGGTVRIANGCEVREGHLLRTGMPQSWLARFQIVEYLRGFLFGRMGWSRLNGLLIISGAFGIFRKDTVVEAGGYDPKVKGEDMEIVVRIHRFLRQKRRPYRVVYVPDPVCWTEAPEARAALRNQRVRWHRGLSESLWMNRKMLFTWPPDVAGWIAFPYFVLFEWAAPIVEAIGYFVLVYLLVAGLNAGFAFMTLLIAISFSVLLSTLALMLEEMSFHMYPERKDIMTLFSTSIIENFGYRQLNIVWRLVGIWQWLAGTQTSWGDMQRKGIGTRAGPP